MTEATPIESERMCYRVRSRTNPARTYRVDLLACAGYGRCACADWETRRWVNIREGLPMGLRTTMCHHVIVARRHFLNGLLKTMAANEGSSSIHE